MVDLVDLLLKIIQRDLAGGGPSSLAIDCIDPDRFSGIESQFIAIGLVEYAEATGSALVGKTPVLGEWLLWLESPVGGSDGSERVLRAHDCSTLLVGTTCCRREGDAPARRDATCDDFLSALSAFAEGPRLVLSGDLPVGVDDFLESVHSCDVGFTTGNTGIKKAPSLIG